MPLVLRRIPLLTLSAKSFGSFLTLGWVGANAARTLLLVPALLGRARRGNRAVGVAALLGFAGGILLLLVLALLGVEELPTWTMVPPTIITVQGFYGLLMNAVVPNAYEPAVELSAGDLAFTLYGLMLYPPTILFVVVMTASSLLS